MKIDITLYVVTPHDISLLRKSPGLSCKVEQVKGPKPHHQVHEAIEAVDDLC